MARSTRTRTLLAGAAVLSLLVAALVLWRLAPAPVRPADTPPTGGTLIATVRSEPRSFNRLIARDRTSHLLSLLLHASLVRLDLATQEVQPWLAERWEISPDGRAYTFHLRRGVTFSDGAPFSADDVQFTFAALFDAKVASPLATGLLVRGEPPEVAVRDPHTVTVTFPGPFTPALRAIAGIPVLPAHRLAAALEAGTFRDVWTVTTPPADLSGLGPFVLREYVPGVRIDLARNPRYWRRDADGVPLPRLDGLTLLVVPDQNAEMLRLESGEVDLVSSEARAEDIAALQRAASEGRLQVVEVGIGLDPDMFWFNLRPDPARDADRPWLTRPELRRAISLGVDRQAFVDIVYLGAGAPVDTPITPGNRLWHDPARPAPRHDPAEAARLLDDLGLVDRDGNGVREAASGRPARFTVLTQKGNSVRERAAAFLQQQLARLGLQADLVALEAGALVDRLTKGEYEAAWFGAQSSDTDPTTHLDFWLSSGSFHVWHPNQPSPATDWEHRIDEAMHRMVTTLDPAERRRLFTAVLEEFTAAQPVLYFAAPRVVVAMSRRVGHARPALLQPAILWNADELTVSAGR